jgi:hypothetical protein
MKLCTIDAVAYADFVYVVQLDERHGDVRQLDFRSNDASEARRLRRWSHENSLTRKQHDIVLWK